MAPVTRLARNDSGRAVGPRILAQLIKTIHEAGAAVFGTDHRLNYASPARIGGAASDALFLEALRTTSPADDGSENAS